MTKSGVPWADYRWNCVEGCSPVSESCLNCYAKTFAHRFHRHWGSPIFHEDRLEQPLHTKRPGRVFVCSTSDFFHEKCEPIWQDRMGLIMAKAHRHVFILLTKRPHLIQPWLDRMIDDGLWPLTNVWIGVTAENQERLQERWPILYRTHAAVKFVSIEPMLTPVTFSAWSPCDLPDLVICGPENGRGKRPFEDEWLESLAHECACFFDKRKIWRRREFPKG